MKKIQTFFNTRLGFTALLVLLMWFKTVFVYYTDFSLGIENPLQHIILILNPIATTIILLSLPLFINRAVISYIISGLVYIVETGFLYANVLYYRQFNDFISYSTIAGSTKVAKGLSGSVNTLLHPTDIIIFLDFIIILGLFAFKIIKINPAPLRKLTASAVLVFGIFFLFFNLMLAESNRPQLLGRGFDRNYVVKYLGLNSFLAYDSVKTIQTNQTRSEAVGTDMDEVLDYVSDRYAAPNSEYFGVAKQKNIIIIHLESFQQQLIGAKVNGHEVTPFLNSIYNDKNTLSFDNFYNQVGEGRTADAENLLETSTFGQNGGSSLFVRLGGDNTFQAAPAILAQEQGYTSAVFHGNTPGFWGRDKVYPNLGYNYFFSQNYYDASEKNSLTQYGLKDKLLFAESAKYLEQMQQPFYTKFITVSNHTDYQLDSANTDQDVIPNTSSSTVNRYFGTANYLDSSVKEFFDYLKASGIYDNSIIMLYGDHYGLNSADNSVFAKQLGYVNSDKDGADFINSQGQKVPLMFHMPGLKGGIKHTYGGEVDVLPTLLHLAGINTKGYVQLGTDLLSKDHNQIVAFRKGSFVTPKYTVIKKGDSHEVFKNDTGEEIDLSLNPDLKEKISKWQKQVDALLDVSDNITNKNLLRFYTPNGFTPVDPSLNVYNDQIQRLISTRDNLGDKSTSVYSKNGNKSTTDLYKTDAPELNGDRTDIDSWDNILNK
ncbi:LTA synthase family protein [Companilactobacillus metriopterae]|uniref:LTA synthase family protein n=1 Tax=Companilactobacillus metriopterae TaxID=1909267 RepID=UPI00100B126E|nr:LTA synthase family protein [Companilactobacillus metriopterae]